MIQSDERLLVKSEAARLLGVTPATVRALEIAGHLPALKTPGGIRLFREAEVIALAERRAQQPHEREPERTANQPEADRG